MIENVTNGGFLLPNFIFYRYNSPINRPFAAIQRCRNVGSVHPTPPQVQYGVFVIGKVKTKVIIVDAAHSEIKLTSHCQIPQESA